MPKQSLQQFGASIKAKHPEYGDMADEDVGEKVLNKYPQYGDMVDSNRATQTPVVTPPQAPAQPKAGGLFDTIGNVASHVAGNISGAYHAVTDPPQNAAETAMGPALPAYRAAVKPSVDAAVGAYQQYKAGNTGSLNGQQYDSQGNYKPTAVSLAEDAIPIAGPWSRSIDNDAQKKGAIPALAGAITDYGMGKAAEGVGPAMRGAGTVTKYLSSDTPSLGLATTRALVPGSPGELLNRGLKPGVHYGNAAQTANLFEDTVQPVLDAGRPLRGVTDYANAADAARDASASQHNAVIAPYRSNSFIGTAPKPSSLSGEPIADAQMQSIPYIDRLEQPTVRTGGTPGKTGGRLTGIVPDTASVADNYRRDFSAPELDQVREDANAKLNAFYNKAGGDQHAALSNPETARYKAVGDTSRDVLYPFLEADNGLPEGSIAANQQMYGKLSDVGDIASGRSAVAGRHDPISLAEKVATGHPGGITSRVLDFASQKLLRGVTDSDALVRSAVDRYQNPSPLLPPRPGVVPGMFSQGANVMFDAPTIDPRTYTAPPNSYRKRK